MYYDLTQCDLRLKMMKWRKKNPMGHNTHQRKSEIHILTCMRIKVKNVSARGHDKHHTFPTVLKSINTCPGPYKEGRSVIVP